MRETDLLRFSGSALARAPGRSALLLLAMAIGVAAVVVLTALGEGARRFVTGEFSSLGTNLLIVIPGRSETTGGAPALLAGQTPRDLTLDDALALTRDYNVARVAPVVIGQAEVSYRGLSRETPVIGSTAELLEVRHWKMSLGRFLPTGDPRRGASVAAIGEKVRSELFGNANPVGEWLRLGENRYRVIGVVGSEGRSIGVDVQELVIVPVSNAQALFNTPSLFRILVEARSREAMEPARRHVLATVAQRHQGEEDITVITQDAVLATFDRIFTALTLTVGGIAGVSLGVAGVLIMNVMLVSVSQRTGEIGLLKAVGAAPRQILAIFLAEAVLLSMLGAALGLALGGAGILAIGRLYPALDFTPPLWAVLAACAVALVSGVLFGLLPARRAALLDPVAALGAHGQ